MRIWDWILLEESITEVEKGILRYRMKKYRIKQVIHEKFKPVALNVAIASCFFNEIGLLKSIENLQLALKTVG